MNIYSYSKDDNKYRKEIEKIIKKNLLSFLIFKKIEKLKKIIKNHPESILSDYEVVILSNKKNLTLLQICAYYSTPEIIDALFKMNYFDKKEKIMKERYFYKDESEDYIDDEKDVNLDTDDINKNINDNKITEIQNAMYYALLGGNKKNFLLLLKHGGMVNESISNEWSEENHDTPLGVAIALNDFKLADEIIKLGGSIDNIGYGLHYAIKYLKLEQVKYIVDKGGDINLQDSGGRLPLFYLVFSEGIYKEKVSNKIYKIIDCLESKGSKIYWGEQNYLNERNKKFNLLNGLLSAGNIKKPLIEYCVKKGGFLDSNNVHVRSTTVRMMQSLYNSNLLINIEKYGLNIINSDVAFYMIKNSFEGIKKINVKPILEQLKKINPELDLRKNYTVTGHNINYPVNILFYVTLSRDFEAFEYLLKEELPEIPEKLNMKFKSIYDYLLNLLLIESYKYKKENLNLNKENHLIKMIRLLIDKGANPMIDISYDKDKYPLVLRFLDDDLKIKSKKDKSELIIEKNRKLRKEIFDSLLESNKVDKKEILLNGIIFYFKLLNRCNFEEEQLVKNDSLYKINKSKKEESYGIVEKLFEINGIDKKSNTEKDVFYKKALIYFLENKDNQIYNYLLTTEIVKDIINNEKNNMLGNLKKDINVQNNRKRL